MSSTASSLKQSAKLWQGVWVAFYNGPGDGIDRAAALSVDGYGNVYVTGRSTGDSQTSDIATIKYSPDGEELWVIRHSGPAGLDDEGTGIALDPEGNVYVTGFSTTDTHRDYITIKYEQTLGLEESQSEFQAHVRVFPKPVTTSAMVKVAIPGPAECLVQVFSIDGRLVETVHRGVMPGGEHTLAWYPSGMASGLYFVRVRTDYEDRSYPVVVLR